MTINVGTGDINLNAVYKDNGISLLGITTTIPVLGVDGLVDIDGATITGKTVSLTAFAATLSTTARTAQTLTGSGDTLKVASVAGFDDTGSFSLDISGTPTTCTYTGRDIDSTNHTTSPSPASTAAADRSSTARRSRRTSPRTAAAPGINHAGLDLEYHANVNVHGDTHITATGNVTLASTIDVTATAKAAAGPDKGNWASGTGV